MPNMSLAGRVLLVVLMCWAAAEPARAQSDDRVGSAGPLRSVDPDDQPFNGGGVVITRRGRPAAFEFYLTVCNQTPSSVSLALGYWGSPTATRMTVKGWWNIAGQSCRAIGTLGRSNFYYHATSREGVWGRGQDLCVRDRAFNYIAGVQACDGPWALAGFSRADVRGGQFTLRLR